VSSGITVCFNLRSKDVAKLQPSEIDLQLTAPGREEEVESWNDVFGIEERYKAKICAKNDGKAWLQNIIEEASNYGISPTVLLDQVSRAADRSPYSDANFLKKPFLIACQSAGII